MDKDFILKFFKLLVRHWINFLYLASSTAPGDLGLECFLDELVDCEDLLLSSPESLSLLSGSPPPWPPPLGLLFGGLKVDDEDVG